MFIETESTPEICVGEVKTHTVHHKNPAQHAADLIMLGDFEDQIDFGEKKIYCIRVNGASDERPSHSKVQFMWTEHHIIHGKQLYLVISRFSG